MVLSTTWTLSTSLSIWSICPPVSHWKAWHTHILVLCEDFNRHNTSRISWPSPTNPDPNLNPILSSKLKPGIHPQTVLWKCEDQPECAHFVSQWVFLVLRRYKNTHKGKVKACWYLRPTLISTCAFTANVYPLEEHLLDLCKGVSLGDVFKQLKAKDEDIMMSWFSRVAHRTLK